MMTREDILAKNPNASERQIQKTLEYFNDEFYTAKNVARAAGQGLTFGFGDELTAFAKQMFGKGSYDELVEEERAKLNQFREANPALAYGMEIGAGFLIPGFGMAKGAVTAGKAGLTAAKGAKIGATQGALYGAGAGEGSVLTQEGLMSRGGGAVVGAGLGAGMGAALPKVFRGIGTGGGWAAKRLRHLADSLFHGRDTARRGIQQTNDQRLVQQRLEKAFREQLELDDPKLLKQYDEAGIPASEAYRSKVSAMGEYGTIADIPGMESIVSGVTQGYGGARQIARKAFRVRAEKEFDILMNEAEDVMRATHGADDMINRVSKIAERRSQPLYEKAATDVELGHFTFVLADPATKGIYNARKAIVAAMIRRGEISADNYMPSWKDLGKMDTVSSNVMHQLKIAFGKKGKWAKGQVDPKTSHYEGAAMEMKDILSNLVPGYKEATRVYEIGSEVSKWVKQGSGALAKKSATAVADEFGALKGAIAKKAYRSGLLQEIRIRAGDSSLGKWLTQPTNLRARNALEATFPDKKSFQTFLANAERERGFREVEGLAGMGGSRTARTQSDIAAFDQQFNPVELAQEVAHAGTAPLWAASKWYTKALEKIRGIENKRVANQVAEIIFAGGGAQTKRGHWERAGRAGKKWVPEMEGLSASGSDVQKAAFDKLLSTAKDLSDKDRWLVRSIMTGLAATSGQTGGLLPHNLMGDNKGGLLGLATR